MEPIRFIVSTVRKLQIKDSFRINQKLKMLKREDAICFDDVFRYVVRNYSLNIPKGFLFVVVKVLKRSSTKSTGRNTFSLNVVAKKSESLRVR